MKRTWLVASAAGLAVLLATFYAGRATKGVQVKTVDRVQTKTEYKDRVVEKVVHDTQTVHDTQVQTRTVTAWRTLPGGVTTVVQTVEREKQAETKRSEQTVKDRQSDRAAVTNTVELHTVERSAGPKWSVSLMPGVQVFGEKAVTLWGPAVIGAAVEHRFIGPVWLGIYATTSGAAGITIRGDL